MNLIVYDEAPRFQLKPVERELSELGVSLDIRPPLPPAQPAAGTRDAWLTWLSWHLAWSKVRDPQRPIPAGFEPQGLEIERERAALAGEASKPGPLYDGKRLVEAFHGPLPKDERMPGGDPVVVLTDRLIGTFEGARYHVRFLVTGHPSLLSPPGLIDGPARDRAYYVKKQVLGTDADLLADDDHLTKHDDRWPVAVASAFLQLAAYWDRGQAFCQDESCRLYNPHWQAELLGSMATEGLCEEHAAWLSRM